MKAAILGPTYPHRGGIAHYTTLLARALAKRHRLAIVSFRRLYPGLLFPGTTQFDSSREAIEPPVPPEPILDSVNPFSWVRAGARIRAIAPDFLVVPWWHPFFGPSLGTASRGARGKDGGERGRRPARIFLCHNVAPHEATPLDRALTTYGLGAADAFLVHAHAEAKKLEPLAQGRPVRVHPHPTYAIFSERTVSREEARRALSLDGRVLLFFGYVRYRALLEDPALRGRVRVVNRYVPNEEVAPYFAAADVVALPYREATGSGIAQVAFGAGVPVIATRTGGLEEVIEEGVSGLLVPPRDPPALARAIERFFDENLGARLREGVARARGRFEWEGLVQAIESLAEELPR
ncbi:MAG: glycosyltransferase [Candidatus Eisenbacteria bacterium]|uniref:Glycosyltransferase n=1 Tax=Eiseniibacteriota bacterium TaxID=2212470 RepID=A0A538T1Q8_UNCEI|nr:MAG: glycosyltransferase [Candidatus Eisenbacteria bacterium]